MTDKEFLVKYLGRYQKVLAKIAELERYRQWIESNAVSIAGVDTTADKVQSNKRSPFAVEANAKGTKHSADVFLAGEDGPELIVNAGGSQVFTAAETQRILSGDADGDNTTGLTFDIPELLSQLIDYSRAERPTLEDMANDLEEAGNSYNSSYGANQTINYSPSFHIEGSAPSEIVEKVRGAEKISKSEFAKLMREYQLDQNRIKF